MRGIALLASLLVPAVARAAGGRGEEGGSMAMAVFQMLASLAIVIGIIYLLYYLSTRWFRGFTGGRQLAGRIRVIETRYLAPKRSLIVVEVGGEYLLLGSSSDGVQLIKKLENGQVFATENVPSAFRPSPELFRRKFDDLLGKVHERLGAMKRTDFTAARIWSTDDTPGLLTVEQMIERVQAGKVGPAVKVGNKRRKAGVTAAAC
ncbi:MAG TPA: flagellar biosynthetic protein FliO [Geobacteraceae bacterium]|nr:flagellar biosynthetic protein FliO [Geobacteraceae bacterium]